ncbi:MAG: hypothetical protein U5K33_08405 [Halofilum sp. (in: g-proteobacteria)]|nr:hypothetical protein [Halofilum sp. (in: g-proteobacteria)]
MQPREVGPFRLSRLLELFAIEARQCDPDALRDVDALDGAVTEGGDDAPAERAQPVVEGGATGVQADAGVEASGYRGRAGNGPDQRRRLDRLQLQVQAGRRRVRAAVEASAQAQGAAGDVGAQPLEQQHAVVQAQPQLGVAGLDAAGGQFADADARLRPHAAHGLERQLGDRVAGGHLPAARSRGAGAVLRRREIAVEVDAVHVQADVRRRDLAAGRTRRAGGSACVQPQLQIVDARRLAGGGERERARCLLEGVLAHTRRQRDVQRLQQPARAERRQLQPPLESRRGGGGVRRQPAARLDHADRAQLQWIDDDAAAGEIGVDIATDRGGQGSARQHVAAGAQLDQQTGQSQSRLRGIEVRFGRQIHLHRRGP